MLPTVCNCVNCVFSSKKLCFSSGKHSFFAKLMGFIWKLCFLCYYIGIVELFEGSFMFEEMIACMGDDGEVNEVGVDSVGGGEKGSGQTKAGKLRGRVFNIMQYEKHPESGEVLITAEKIAEVLEKRKVFKRWAWIAHDKDVYQEHEVGGDIDKVGTVKPLHFHIVVECPSGAELGRVASYFGIPENFVQIPKGRGAFLDCVRYLTHADVKQQEKGKFVYDDEEVHANFDWKKSLVDGSSYDLRKRAGITVDRWVCRVATGELSLKECRDSDMFAYLFGKQRLEKAREDYLNSVPVPQVRINYYLYGSGGVGKGLMSRALARSLYPNLDSDDEIFFEVGSLKSPFDGYNNQPVLIWNDCRVVALLEALGGRDGVFDVFDTAPTTKRQNIKYGSVVLVNHVNIVNGVEDYKKFLDGLAGEYYDSKGNLHHSEDKNQSYRRFPIIVPIRANDFDLFINKGFMSGNPELYQQYECIKNLKGGLRNFVSEYGGNAYRQIENKVCGEIVSVDKMLRDDKTAKKEVLDDDFLEGEFKQLGLNGHVG